MCLAYSRRYWRRRLRKGFFSAKKDKNCTGWSPATAFVRSALIGRFCSTLELIELRLKMLIRCARFLIRNIHTENTYGPCFIRRPVRMRRPPIPPNLLFRAKKKVQLSGELDQKRKLVVALLDFSFRHLSPSQLE